MVVRHLITVGFEPCSGGFWLAAWLTRPSRMTPKSEFTGRVRVAGMVRFFDTANHAHPDYRVERWSISTLPVSLTRPSKPPAELLLPTAPSAGCSFALHCASTALLADGLLLPAGDMNREALPRATMHCQGVSCTARGYHALSGGIMHCQGV